MVVHIFVYYTGSIHSVLFRRMASNVATDESATSDYDDIEHHLEFIHKEWTKRTDKNKRFVIITAGKAGVGKSTLINNFLQLEGDAMFVARLDPHSVTRRVEYCDKEINGVQVRVIDMPGLHAPDSGDKTDQRTDIIGDLKGVTENGADVVFYCINLMNRLDTIDYENMDTLTREFGSEIWEHVIFVFTHTDVVLFNGSSPEELVEKYIEALRNHLVEKRKVNVKIRSIYSFPDYAVSKNAEINDFTGIVGIPVSKDPGVPPKWRITLLLQVIRKCREENIPAILKLHYIDWDEVKKTAAIVAAGGVGGAFAHTLLRGAVGAVVGASLGGYMFGTPGVALGSAGIGTLFLPSTIGLTTLVTRIAFVIHARHKIEKRARLKIKEMLEKEKKIAQEASVPSPD